MLLGVVYIFLYQAIYFDDSTSLLYALFVLIIAGIEAAVGLGLIIKLNKQSGNIEYK